MKDYYKILGVGETATNEQIKKAFKDIAKKEHPDRGGNETKFKEANEAHDTLTDSQKRHQYDTQRKFGSTGEDQHPFFNEEIFGDFFSGFGGGDMDFNGRFNFTSRDGRTSTFRTGPRANRNVQVRMAISIKEAMMHNEKTINYKLPSGREEFSTVKIPAGVQHGVTFKFKGMGDDSIKNAPRGDLLVQMSVLDSDGYTRKVFVDRDTALVRTGFRKKTFSRTCNSIYTNKFLIFFLQYKSIFFKTFLSIIFQLSHNLGNLVHTASIS